MYIKDFPILKKVIFLDSAGGTLKPKNVIKKINEFYLKYPINPHNDDSFLGSIVMKQIFETRKLLAELVESDLEEIIFTSGATESLNKLARMLEPFLKEKEEILISSFNHSSNIVPWMELAKRTKTILKISNNIIKDINHNTKIIAYSQMNNSIIQKHNTKKLYQKAQINNIFLINDAAQAISHEKVSLKYCDAITISGNKIYGPTGIGALIIQKKWFAKFKPVTFGGGGNIVLDKKTWKYKENFMGFEVGTPNTAGIIGFGEAIKYFNTFKDKINFHDLAIYCYEELFNLKNINILSQKGDSNILFNIKNIPSQDVVSFLGHKNIILRSGKFCAPLSFENFQIKDAIRISFGIYNSKKDIDILIQNIQENGNLWKYFHNLKYKQKIMMQHYLNPMHKQNITIPDIALNSTSCVDDLKLKLYFKNNILKKIIWHGEGCIVFQSSVDIFLEMIQNKNKKFILNLINEYENMIDQKSKFNKNILGKLGIFSKIKIHLNRVKCAKMISQTLIKYFKI